jgi:ankyrin repeat protein
LFIRSENSVNRIKTLKTMIQNRDSPGVSRLITQHPQLIEADLGECSGDNLRSLKLAVNLDQEAICRLLISAGANVNAMDVVHSTPLEAAVHNCNTNLIVVLLEHGADIRLKDEYGRTPLDLAKENHVPDSIVQILLSAMAKATNQ